MDLSPSCASAYILAIKRLSNLSRAWRKLSEDKDLPDAIREINLIYARQIDFIIYHDENPKERIEDEPTNPSTTL